MQCTVRVVGSQRSRRYVAALAATAAVRCVVWHTLVLTFHLSVGACLLRVIPTPWDGGSGVVAGRWLGECYLEEWRERQLMRR